jgi:tRNA dimethylallyltransferase
MTLSSSNGDVPDDPIQLALDCWYVTGPTASGKTKIGFELAKILDAEIISLDSMTIYRGMDIGTAKPPMSMRDSLPHHLIDICDPIENFTVSRYRDLALSTVRQIRQRGKQIVFVGGTALYLKAMLRGLFEGPPANWNFRNAIEQELESVGLDALYQRLEVVDPLAASKLHRNDKRRIIRALEVHSTTGFPISHLQSEFDHAHSPDKCKVFTLRHSREVLHERIERRVDEMFANGLVEEVTGLLGKWGELGRTAAQAVGYRETIAHLRGEIPANELRQQTLFSTRRFARHQETWFRGLEECRGVDVPESLDIESDGPLLVARQIVNLAGISV